MTNFSFCLNNFIVTISKTTEISVDDVYSTLKEYSSSEQGIVQPDIIEKRDAYTIIDNYRTDKVMLLKDPWRIAFDEVQQNGLFQVFQITGGVLVRNDESNPYIEQENQFIQNLAKMHTKFPRMAATNQLEIDYYRLQNRENPIANLSLAYFDIDDFKVFNTKYGEIVVDSEILLPFHEWLISKSTPNALTYLEGGDEFIILLPGMNLDRAKLYCKQLLSDIKQRIFWVNNHEQQFTVSIGLTSLSNGAYLHDLKKAANHAKSTAKTNGKDRLETE